MNRKPPVVRAAGEGDAASLAMLMTELGYPTSEVEMAGRLRFMADPSYATLVATVDNQLCGMIGLVAYRSHQHDGVSGRILALAVSKEMRRHGVGRALMEEAERYFSEHEIKRVMVTTRLEREVAHRFYESLGYARTGLRFAKKLPGEAGEKTST